MAHFGRGLDYESMLRFGTPHPNIFIEGISFVPTDDEVKTLVEIGKQTRRDLDKYQEMLAGTEVDEELRTRLTSTMSKEKKSLTLPQDTPLSKNADKSSSAMIYSGRKIAVGVPRSTPYASANMGPQICIAVSKKDPIINLFHESPSFVYGVASDVRRFANENGLKLVSALRYMCTVAASNSAVDVADAVDSVAGLEEFIGTDVMAREALEKKIVEKGAQVDINNARLHFRNTMTMLTCVEECIRRGTTLSDMGLTFELFCQTWDVQTFEPNFSVPSPHFQTCLIVTDRARLLGHMQTIGTSGVGEEHIESFETLSSMLTDKMGAYKNKFVRVSGMAS
jgi:hypothetical protein